MDRDPQDSWNDLVARGMDLSVGMVRLYGETWRALVTRQVSLSELAHHATDLAHREGGAYTRAMTRAGIDYWERVLKTGTELKDRAASYAEDGDARRRGDPGEAPGGGGRARLDFTGASGDEVTRAFLVENNQSEAVSVSFEISPFVDVDGSGQQKLAVVLDPEAFDLAPGEERIVSCRVVLGQDLLVGRPYHALLRVIGFPDMAITISATVTAG